MGNELTVTEQSTTAQGDASINPSNEPPRATQLKHYLPETGFRQRRNALKDVDSHDRYMDILRYPSMWEEECMFTLFEIKSLYLYKKDGCVCF